MTSSPYHQVAVARPEPPVGCPVNHTFSPLAPDYLADPYPIASAIRNETPIMYSEQLGMAVVSEMALVTEVFMNPEAYSPTNVQDPIFPVCEAAVEVLAAPDFNPVAVMSNREEPDHGRIRQYTKLLFSNRRIQTLEPYICRRANELIDDMLAQGPPADLVASLAYPLPGEVIFRFIGFPEHDDQQLKDWCADRLSFSWGSPSDTEQVEIAEKMLAYWRYVRDFMQAKSETPGDDLASELLGYHHDNPDDLSYREVESIVYGLSFAGHEPVTFLVGNALLSLLPRRDRWAELCADRSLVPGAIEEVIRWNSPQIGWRRVARHDTELGGVTLPAGTQVYLNLGAANRDPAAFDQPDDFDLHRSDAARNISFGKGNHYCLGAKFARFEARLILDTIIDRIPSLELVAGTATDPFPNVTFRGPSQLHATWSG